MNDPIKLPPYSGWRPYLMRRGRGKYDNKDRNAKRSRLGNRHDRALYKSSHALTQNPTRYASLCVKACRLVYKRDRVGDV